MILCIIGVSLRVLMKSSLVQNAKLVFFVVTLLMTKWVCGQYAHVVKISPISGVVVIGYVDQGAFMNVLGPNVRYKRSTYECSVGLLPSLKLKKDQNLIKNSFVTPSLGVGLTFKRKRMIFQLPLYYKSKTATVNGRWDLGFGLGYSF